MLAGLMTVAGELLLLAVALGCQSWRGLLGSGAAPLTLFLSYGYVCVYLLPCEYCIMFLDSKISSLNEEIFVVDHICLFSENRQRTRADRNLMVI